VQVLAATHADLEAEVAARRFRADLLYRLNTVRVDLPPLRQRRDFAQVVRSVLAGLDPHAGIDNDALALLARHRWPGNFRELRSVLTRALLQGGQVLDTGTVARWLPAAVPSVAASVLQQGAAELVRREFDRCGNVSVTARTLGISRTTVYRHLRAAG